MLNYLVIYMLDDFCIESLWRKPGLQFSEVLLVGVVTARHLIPPEKHVLPLWGPNVKCRTIWIPLVSHGVQNKGCRIS